MPAERKTWTEIYEEFDRKMDAAIVAEAARGIAEIEQFLGKED